MMRTLFVLFLSVTIMLSVNSVSLFAYRPEMRLYNQEMEMTIGRSEISIIEEEILRQAGVVIENVQLTGRRGLGSLGVDYLESFDITRAVKAISIDNLDNIPEEMSRVTDVVERSIHVRSYDIFDSGFLDYLWRIPILETEYGYIFSSVRICVLGNHAIWTTTTMVDEEEYIVELNDVTYLFDHNLIPNILFKSGLYVDFATVIPITFPAISTDIIYFRANDNEYAIVFSSRPDLLGVRNGEIYEYEELKIKIDTLVNRRYPHGDTSFPVGGSGGGLLMNDSNIGSTNRNLITSVYFAMSVMLVSSVILIYYKINKS